MYGRKSANNYFSVFSLCLSNNRLSRFFCFIYLSRLWHASAPKDIHTEPIDLPRTTARVQKLSRLRRKKPEFQGDELCSGENIGKTREMNRAIHHSYRPDAVCLLHIFSGLFWSLFHAYIMYTYIYSNTKFRRSHEVIPKWCLNPNCTTWN